MKPAATVIVDSSNRAVWPSNPKTNYIDVLIVSDQPFCAFVMRYATKEKTAIPPKIKKNVTMRVS